MNEHLHDNQDERLSRLLRDAVGPDSLTDHEVEQLLNSADTSPLTNSQSDRILSYARRLTDQHDAKTRLAVHRQQLNSNPARESTTQSEIVMKRVTDSSSRNRSPKGAITVLAVSCLSLLAVLMLTSEESARQQKLVAQRETQQEQELFNIRNDWLTARHIAPVALQKVQVGDTITTSATERRRVGLPDGSVLFVNSNAQVKVATDRRVEVDRGEVFVEVVPQFDENEQRELFEIATPYKTVTALGTKFAVDANDEDTDVLVTQGKVKVTGVDKPVEAGQRLTAPVAATKPAEVAAAPRASEALAWTRDLIALASPLLPTSEYAGGAIITVDPDGQEMQLSLRKYHVDVHIEDGFARTTIDQTYFNHTSQRLEGTFHFPLPPDASLSRLAMYVNGKLMEGGMAERDHARNTFEQIVTKMKDPALLEWVDGSTFKMRVFPLEPRQEKRIVLSYTQRLASAYGKTHYRFPAGHNMDVVRDWSAQIRVHKGANDKWTSPSHEFTASSDDTDLVLETTEQNSTMDRDLVFELENDEDPQTGTQWSRTVHEDQQYLMLRFRPDLPAKKQRTPRNWIILFESSANRDPLLARTQVEIIRTLLENAEHSDTFSLITAGTRPTAFRDEAIRCSANNVAAAIQHLEETHLVGALNLKKALRSCGNFVSDDTERDNVLVHVGSALPVLGENDQHKLLDQIPDDTAYVGVGVGRRWSQSFMKQAAGKTGGYFTQINPDEEVAWRAFELSSVLNAPRLLDVSVHADDATFLNFADTIVHGEEICAVTRITGGGKQPKSVNVKGTLNGKPWNQTVRVRRVVDRADYLPRTWAKLEIDRLVAENAQQHKDQIITLSKAMYVMSPFTSLLVLENEEMYTQYNIDRGRKDHWALYPCPDEIKVVTEPLQHNDTPVAEIQKSQFDILTNSVLTLPPPQVVTWPMQVVTLGDGNQYWYQPGNNLTTWQFQPLTVDEFSTWGVQPNRHLYFQLNGTANNVWVDFDQDGNSDGFIGNFGTNAVYPYFATPNVRDFGFVPRNSSSVPLGWRNSDLSSPAGVDGWAHYGLWPRYPKTSQLSGLGYGAPLAFGDIDVLADMSADVSGFRFANPNYFATEDFYWLGRTAQFDTSTLSVVEGFNFNQSGQVRPNIKYFLPQGQPLNNSRMYWDSGLVPTQQMLFGTNVTSLRSQLIPLSGLEDREHVVRLLGVPGLESLANSSQLGRYRNIDRFGSGLGVRDEYIQKFVSDYQPVQQLQELVLRERFEVAATNATSTPSVSFTIDPSLADDLQQIVVVPDDVALQIVARESSLRQQIQLRQVTVDENALASALQGLFDEQLPALQRSQPGSIGGHPWANAPNQHKPPFVSLPTFGPTVVPEFGNDRRLFGDLMSHAPGLNSSQADLLHVLATETDDRKPPVAGKIDKQARQLINKARSTAWELVQLPGKSADEQLEIQVDGLGRYTWTRIVSEGLTERVVCDGKSLLHLYDDIGLGARREYSRFHAATIHQLIPWLVPSVDELSIGHDLVAIDDHTVAIIPVEPEGEEPDRKGRSSRIYRRPADSDR